MAGIYLIRYVKSEINLTIGRRCCRSCFGDIDSASVRLAVAVFSVLLWGILTPVIAVVLLRFLKATLIALQFKNKAEEGRLSRE